MEKKTLLERRSRIIRQNQVPVGLRGPLSHAQGNQPTARQVRLARVQKGSVALDRSRPFETEFTRADEDENDHDTEHFDCARILRKTVGMLAKS